MITGELRNKIDKIWETFWTGGITNPLDVIEQFTYLLFIKQLDEVETTKENEANFLGVDYESMFPGECQKYRWSKFKNRHQLPQAGHGVSERPHRCHRSGSA